MLAWHEKVYEMEHRCLPLKEMNALLPVLKTLEETKWLAEVIALSLQMAVKDLDTAYDRFFSKVSNKPKFKSKNDRQCFKVAQNFKLEAGKLWIPKLGSWIKVNISREITGKIIFLHISKSATGKYYVSFTVAGEKQTFEKTGKQTGADLGIRDAVILADGTKYENIKSLDKLIKKLKYEQRQLSKKQKGSNSRQRQRRKIARLHERITSLRNDHIAKMTTEIVKNHDLIAVEDLAVKNMIRNHHLAKSLADVSLGRIRTQLKYKSQWHDRTFVMVGRFYASSKICSACDWKKEDLTLSDRSWICPACGTHHDRDVNAARNILREGLKIMSECGMHPDKKQKQEEASSMEESMNPEELMR